MGVGGQGQTAIWAGVAGSNVDRRGAETKAKGELGRATWETRGKRVYCGVGWRQLSPARSQKMVEHKRARPRVGPGKGSKGCGGIEPGKLEDPEEVNRDGEQRPALAFAHSQLSLEPTLDDLKQTSVPPRA